MKSFRLSRRAALLGAGGVAIALPWLEIMTPVRESRAAAATARRFIAVYQPGGTIIERWTPTGSETDYQFGPILAPLSPVKSEVLVLSGLDLQSAAGGGTDLGGMTSLLTGTPPAAAAYAQGPSVDQAIAKRISGGRSLESLNVAVRWGTGRCHGVLHPLDVINYEDTPTHAPIPPRIDPVAIWNLLFGGIVPPPGVAWDRSILDVVDRRYARLAMRLGAADRARLEEHLTKIREIEQRLGSTAGRCMPPTLVDTSDYNPASGLNSSDTGSIKDLPTDAAIPKVGKLMIDMMVMAFACDLTAVGTLQWTDAECKHTLPWLGLTEPHRFYMNDGGFRAAECEQIATWYSEQHTYLLQQMAQVDMGGHTLLDESVVFIGAHLQHPATYVKTNMPFLLAGRGGGLRPGRWLRYASESHNHLLVALLHLFGDTRATFGDTRYSTRSLTNLT